MPYFLNSAKVRQQYLNGVVPEIFDAATRKGEKTDEQTDKE